MTNIVNSTLPIPNNHSEKNKPDGVFVIKQGKTNYKVKVFFDHSSGLTAVAIPSLQRVSTSSPKAGGKSTAFSVPS